MTIAICTPWWNCHELGDEYRKAVYATDAERVLVLDQASDPPIDLLGCEVFRGKANVGFSRACNWLLGRADTDAVVWLNNDVVLDRPDNWLEPIRAALKPGVLVGAQLRRDEHAAVDGMVEPWLDGWCLAGMRQDLLDLGGWDESYEEPSYFGDNDLSFRAARAGLELVEVPVGLRHLVTYTGAKLDLRGVTARNHRRFVEKVRASKGVEV
jgi:GT2 family glycosyltransferase